MALTYVCSPLSAPTRAEITVNSQRARTYMAMCEREFGCRAVAPHAYLPYLLDDSNPEERALALSFGASLLALCDRLVIYGDRISSGMKEEIRRSRELGIPILNRQTQLSDGSSDPVIVGRYINGICPGTSLWVTSRNDCLVWFRRRQRGIFQTPEGFRCRRHRSFHGSDGTRDGKDHRAW